MSYRYCKSSFECNDKNKLNESKIYIKRIKVPEIYFQIYFLGLCAVHSTQIRYYAYYRCTLNFELDIFCFSINK